MPPVVRMDPNQEERLLQLLTGVKTTKGRSREKESGNFFREIYTYGDVHFHFWKYSRLETNKQTTT